MNKIMSGLMAIALLLAAGGVLIGTVHKTMENPQSWSPETKEKEAVYASIEKVLIPTVEKVQRGETPTLDEIGSYVETLANVAWHLKHSNVDLRIKTQEVARRNASNWLGAEIRSNPKEWLKPLRTLEVLLRVMASDHILSLVDLNKADINTVEVTIGDLEKAAKVREKIEANDKVTRERLNGIKGIIGDPEELVKRLPSKKKLESGVELLKKIIKEKQKDNRRPTDLYPDEGRQVLVMNSPTATSRKGSR
jgi:hypothetical protein